MAVEIESILGSTANRRLSRDISVSDRSRRPVTPIVQLIDPTGFNGPERYAGYNTTRHDCVVLPRQGGGRGGGRMGDMEVRRKEKYRQRIIVLRIILPFQPPTPPSWRDNRQTCPSIIGVGGGRGAGDEEKCKNDETEIDD